MKNLSIILACALAAFAQAAPLLQERGNATLTACQQIASQFSGASAVAYPPSLNYLSGNLHYSPTNMAIPTCVVYPATVADVGTILRIVGPAKVPFNIKGGGHCLNAQCSSTTGVLVVMTKWNQVVYDKMSNTVQVGTGLTWDDVYSELEGTGATVVGGRVSGIGVAGFALGGGYSYRTSQYGLTSDTIVQYELVGPSGTATNITSTSNPDIFFGLAGGFNNFGIVTRLWLEAFPAPPQIWGGPQPYPGAQAQDVLTACSEFDMYNTDPKAAVLCDYNLAIGTTSIIVIAFYDGPQPPTPSPFANFTKLAPVTSTWRTQSMTSLVKSLPAELLTGQRGYYHSTVVRQITPAVVTAIGTIADKYRAQALVNTGVLLQINPEPFTSGFFSHSRDSAYPHTSNNELRPVEVGVVWVDPLSDGYFANLCKEIANEIHAAAVTDGQDLSSTILYPNYVLADTPLAQMYGSNVARLRSIVKSWDPQGVMTLTGNFKFATSP